MKRPGSCGGYLPASGCAFTPGAIKNAVSSRRHPDLRRKTAFAGPLRGGLAHLYSRQGPNTVRHTHFFLRGLRTKKTAAKLPAGCRLASRPSGPALALCSTGAMGLAGPIKRWNDMPKKNRPHRKKSNTEQAGGRARLQRLRAELDEAADGLDWELRRAETDVLRETATGVFKSYLKNAVAVCEDYERNLRRIKGAGDELRRLADEFRRLAERDDSLTMHWTARSAGGVTYGASRLVGKHEKCSSTPESFHRLATKVAEVGGIDPQRWPELMLGLVHGSRSLHRTRQSDTGLTRTANGPVYQLRHYIDNAAEAMALVLDDIALRIDIERPKDEGPPDGSSGLRRRARQKLAPSRTNAKVIYDWAMSNIDGADGMTLNELHEAIMNHPKADAAMLDMLPDRADTFGRYLRDAGVTRYDNRGRRHKRISHFKRSSQS